MSEDEKKQRLMELFAEGASLGPDERLAFIERFALGDAELRPELQELLEVEAWGLEGFLTDSVARVTGDVTPPIEGEACSIRGVRSRAEYGAASSIKNKPLIRREHRRGTSVANV